jgi:HlyD family secretion protein
VRKKDGTVEQREVTAGLQDANFVEITSGLKIGEEIVVYPYMAISKTLQPGAAVEVTTKDKIFVK